MRVGGLACGGTPNESPPEGCAPYPAHRLQFIASHLVGGGWWVVGGGWWVVGGLVGGLPPPPLKSLWYSQNVF